MCISSMCLSDVTSKLDLRFPTLPIYGEKKILSEYICENTDFEIALNLKITLE